MQFLKTLFWVLAAVILAVFALYNWTPVTVRLWQDLRMDTFLPVLVIGAFVVGVLLVWFPHRASVWSWRRKVNAIERKLAEERDSRQRAEEQLLNECNRSSVADPDPLLESRDTVVVAPARDADGRPLADEDGRPL